MEDAHEVGEEGEGAEDEGGCAEGALGEADVGEGGEVGACLAHGAAVVDEVREGAKFAGDCASAEAALFFGGDAGEEGLDVGLGEVGFVAGEVEVVCCRDLGGGVVCCGLLEEDLVEGGARELGVGSTDGGRQWHGIEVGGHGGIVVRGCWHARGMWRMVR
ncbi:MAG: hypothetical protein ACF8R7_05690 [Phycisphaerales bacterium JB039]